VSAARGCVRAVEGSCWCCVCTCRYVDYIQQTAPSLAQPSFDQVCRACKLRCIDACVRCWQLVHTGETQRSSLSSNASGAIPLSRMKSALSLDDLHANNNNDLIYKCV
jgi:hypothetical protein